MFAKILYPTDFSEKAIHALEVVKKLREAGTKAVIVLTCIDIREINTMAEMEGFSSLRYDDLVGEIRKTLWKKAEEKLNKLSAELRPLGFSVEERLTEGIPYREILRIAVKENVDAIVIGSTGKGLLKEMVLGSTSEKVVREAVCPVIVVK